MRLAVPAVLGALALAAVPPRATAAVPPPPAWSFAAPLGGFDLGAAQRGLRVFDRRCASCHAAAALQPADLLGLGLDDGEAAALLHARGGSPFEGGDDAPDLSRIERVAGANGLWRLLLAPPTALGAGELPPGHPILHNTGEASDLVTFLAWAARPHQTERRQLGVAILLFGILALGVASVASRRVRRRNHHG